MKVYIVQQGIYSDTSIVGVYVSVEAALAANPVPREGVKRGSGSAERPGGWQQDDQGSWDNGLDWEDAMRIDEYEVEG